MDASIWPARGGQPKCLGNHQLAGDIGVSPEGENAALRGPPITKSGSVLTELSSRRTGGARRLSGASAQLRGREALLQIFAFS